MSTTIAMEGLDGEGIYDGVGGGAAALAAWASPSASTVLELDYLIPRNRRGGRMGEGGLEQVLMVGGATTRREREGIVGRGERLQ